MSAAQSRSARTERGRQKPPTRAQVAAVLKHPMADYGFLLGFTLVLLGIGLIMVLSASTVKSYESTGSSLTLASRQLMFALLGVLSMLVASRLPVSTFRRMAVPVLIVSFSLLVVVLIPGIGLDVNGQRNWIGLGGPFRLQPSEIAKLALIIWIADLLARREHSIQTWRDLLIPLLPVSGIFVFLVLLEGDLGTTLVLMPIVAIMLLVAGTPMKFFAIMGGGVLGMILLMSITEGYRMQRFQTWLDPAADPTGAGWQVIHGQFALASGGWWGEGLGASREKWGFLPEAHTDFIISVIGEELGLVGSISILLLFAGIAVLCTRIAVRAADPFARYVTAGVAVWVVAQAIINIGAVIGALPITGLPLPLVSYGGSSLTITLLALGVVLAFARGEPAAQEYIAARKTERQARRRQARARQRTGPGPTAPSSAG